MLTRTIKVSCIALGIFSLQTSAADLKLPKLKKLKKNPDNRAFDGTRNNKANPRTHWGTSDSNLQRLLTQDYGDSVSTPAGADRPNPRAISNAVAATSGSTPNSKGASDYIWQWGQFIDHDLDLSEGGTNGEKFDIPVPKGDPQFDPGNTGTKTIGFTRTDFRVRDGVREQFNSITAYLDGSAVYGSSDARATALRTNDGTGKLRTSAGNLLPFNTTGVHNAPSNAPNFFLAGDLRANEQAGLISVHTLFVREHNTLATEIKKIDPSLTGEQIFQIARTIVGSEIQAITYNEFLPVLLGPGALSKYKHYSPTVNSGIANSFSTSAYRFGHSMLSSTLLRLDKNNKTIPQGNLKLKDAFFTPTIIAAGGGIEPVLRGLAKQKAQEVDTKVVDAVRNFLFGQPGRGGFDLAALNIQRGRDHGLPSYNDARRELGLTPVKNFSEITSDAATANALEGVYKDVEKVDMWVGGLAEDHHAGAMVGELNFTILKNQFERVRDGDRFWYQRDLKKEWVAWVEKQKLSDIIKRNTSIKGEIQDNVFLVP